MATDTDYALVNATSWLAEIVKHHAWTPVGDDVDENEDAAITWAQESVLSVETRDAWRAVGADPAAPFEFALVLTYGGPALRIYGELDDNAEPFGESLALQYQDWGTLWTNVPLSDAERAALCWFAGCFYYDA